MLIEVEAGSTFVFHVLAGEAGVVLQDCENVTFDGNGLRLVAETPFYSQGRVTRVSDDPEYLWFEASFDSAFLPPDRSRRPLKDVFTRIAFWEDDGHIHNFFNQWVLDAWPTDDESIWRVEV